MIARNAVPIQANAAAMKWNKPMNAASHPRIIPFLTATVKYAGLLKKEKPNPIH
ncbi:hypothetical protein ACFQPF_09585 [Fictibacillus iocasae]|uniref:Uncharacterized protein n=1 Tax=Fictibacillus iocasae TaxID=2715437 RepID=A0ABW2NQB0_9BACL